MTIDNEFKRLIPPLSADEFNQLEQNILQEGIRDALVTWNGILIDGHNRYSIAKRHNLPYKTVEMQFDNRADVIRWIILNQFGRRNLSAYDRSILALRLKPVIAEKAKEQQIRKPESVLQKSAKQKPIDTRQELAKVAGVSHDTIAKVEKIEAKATPKVKADVQSGKISINQAYQTVRRTEAKEEKAQRKQYELPAEMPADLCKLFAEDIKEGLPEVADESVDFIITDPPYSKEYIPLYYDLAIVAGRVLKEGGSLVVMCGQSYLPDVIRALASGGLGYHWCLSYLTPGGQSPRLFKKRVNTFWKPVLWFVKGTYIGDYIGDVLKSDVNDNDKKHHEWGQSVSGMTDIVQRFTNPNDTILDPFLGGGTTGVASVSMMRKFIGSDVEQVNVEKARERIKEAYKIAGSEAGKK